MDSRKTARRIVTETLYHQAHIHPDPEHRQWCLEQAQARTTEDMASIVDVWKQMGRTIGRVWKIWVDAVGNLHEGFAEEIELEDQDG